MTKEDEVPYKIQKENYYCAKFERDQDKSAEDRDQVVVCFDMENVRPKLG